MEEKWLLKLGLDLQRPFNSRFRDQGAHLFSMTLVGAQRLFASAFCDKRFQAWLRGTRHFRHGCFAAAFALFGNQRDRYSRRPPYDSADSEFQIRVGSAIDTAAQTLSPSHGHCRRSTDEDSFLSSDKPRNGCIDRDFAWSEDEYQERRKQERVWICRIELARL